MEKRNVNKNLVAALFVVVAVLGYGLIGKAGNLEPPAGPAPTMKTLDEVEARIPIPGSSSPTGTFVVSSAGSYYLTGDRYANDIGIRVDVDNATIDLNGYSLIGPGAYNGVYMRTKNNVEIRNGTVRNFERGIYESDTSGQNHRIINVRTASNDLDGIHLKGNNHLVKDCTSSNNGTSASSNVYGIYVGIGSTVTGNTAHSNGTSATGSAAYGIYTDYGCTVVGNTASDNGTSATATVIGIYTYYGSTVTGNTCCFNESTGIKTSIGCTVTGNTSYSNGNNGIYTGGGSTVTGNTAYSNGNNGIYANLGCTMTGNSCYSNGGTGIWASSYCLVDQNTAYGNTTNMYTGTGCQVGLNVKP